VRSGDRDCVWFERHQLGEHFCSRDHGYSFLFCDDDFGIIGLHRRRINDNLRITDILGSVAFADDHPHRFEPIGVLRFFDIGTGHDEAKVAQDLSDAAHADTADAYEMNSFYVSEHPVISF
jgi:hypothetical protein